jgi:hypothetical protein
MKYCKDCKHLQIDAGDEQYNARWKCISPRTITNISLTDGASIRRHWIYCDSQRDVDFGVDVLFTACGKRGRFWEPK